MADVEARSGGEVSDQRFPGQLGDRLAFRGGPLFRQVLLEGEPSFDSHPPLPYQEQIDREEIDRWRRRPNPRTVLGQY